MTRLFVALTLLGLLLLTAVTGASAGPVGGVRAATTDTDGTFATTSANLANRRMVGDDTFNELTGTLAYTGRLSGTSVIRGDLIFHADGTASFYDIETFTGTIDGVPGVVTFYTSGGSGADGGYWGTEIVLTAAGDLAGRTGQVDTVGAVLDRARGPEGTYTVALDHGGDDDDGK